MLGNHDAAATGTIGTEWFNSLAAEAAAWTRAHLEPETAASLAELGEVAREGEWSLAHGTLRQPLWEYLITEEAAEGHGGWGCEAYSDSLHYEYRCDQVGGSVQTGHMVNRCSETW